MSKLKLSIHRIDHKCIVTYNGRGEFEENQLEDLIGMSYEEIIQIFNC